MNTTQLTQTPLIPLSGSVTLAGRSHLEIVTAQDRERAFDQWSVLENSIPQVPLMASRDWTECWINHYGDIVPHRYALWRVDGVCRGMALLTSGVDSRVGVWRERTWHLGTAGERDCDSVCVEYNSVLCPPLMRDWFINDLMDQLQRDSSWDSCRLDGFSEEELPESVLENPNWTFQTKQARWTNLELVRQSGRDLISFLGDSTRKNIRQSLRRLENIRFEWAETIEHAQSIFDDLMRLHQSRWNAVGEPGCYSSPRFTAFHRELLERLVPDRMMFARVTNNNSVIGCTQLLIDRNRALVYQGGRCDANHFSPGLVTDFLAMQECVVRGYLAFDFMAGESLHKRRLTTAVTPLVWGSYRRPRWKYRLTDAMRAGRNRYRSLLKSVTSSPDHQTEPSRQPPAQEAAHVDR